MNSGNQQLPKFSDVLRKCSGGSIPESLGPFLDTFILDYPEAANNFSIAYHTWLGICSAHQLKEALVEVVDGLLDETLQTNTPDFDELKEAFDDVFKGFNGKS